MKHPKEVLLGWQVIQPWALIPLICRLRARVEKKISAMKSNMANVKVAADPE
jgi:hypothetical protein